jgi:hypothetical protein
MSHEFKIGDYFQIKSNVTAMDLRAIGYGNKMIGEILELNKKHYKFQIVDIVKSYQKISFFCGEKMKQIGLLNNLNFDQIEPYNYTKSHNHPLTNMFCFKTAEQRKNLKLNNNNNNNNKFSSELSEKLKTLEKYKWAWAYIIENDDIIW